MRSRARTPSLHKTTFSLAVIAAACLLAAACAQQKSQTPLYTGATHGPLVPPSHEEMVKVAARAPDPSTLSFGPGVDVHLFKPAWGWTDARIVGDVIYVLYTPDPTQTTKRLGILRDATLHPVFLRGEYADIAFVDHDTGLVAVWPNRQRDVYALVNGNAILTKKQSQQTILSPETHTLEDGGTCSDPTSDNSALDEIRAGRRSTLLTSEQLGKASFGMLDVTSDATCDHFHGASYASFGAPSVVFQLGGDRTKLISEGVIDVADEKHMVIELTDGRLVEADVRM